MGKRKAKRSTAYGRAERLCQEALEFVRGQLAQVELGEAEAYELFLGEFEAELRGWQMRLEELHDEGDAES